MRNCSDHRRKGFTLMEMLIYLVAIAVCVALGVALLTTTMDGDRNGESTGQRISRRLSLAQTFRDDVSRAVAAPQEFENLKAGRERLFLQMSDGFTVLYIWDGMTLDRVERKGDFEARRTIPVGPPGTSVEFSDSERLITLHVSLPIRNGCRRADISSALGGNAR